VNIRDINPDPSEALDLTGPPIHECICGSNMFWVVAVFEDYEISTYFTDAICVHCGSHLTAPTYADRPLTDENLV
jgi:hypothetical protein